MKFPCLIACVLGLGALFSFHAAAAMYGEDDLEYDWPRDPSEGGRISIQASFTGTPPGSEPMSHSTWLPVEGDPRFTVRVPDFSERPRHPRLLIRPEDIPELRARAEREPFASMIPILEAAAESPAGLYALAWQTRAYALLYVITGDPFHADKAREKLDLMREDSNRMWYSAASSIRHLNLTQGSVSAALAYDWCYDAWPEDYREEISRELVQQARHHLWRYGDGYPTQGRANNWRGIRFAGAGIALLASDEPHLTAAEVAAFEASGWNTLNPDHPIDGIDPRWMQVAYDQVMSYLWWGLTDDPSARGYNAEGMGYVLYPWQLVAPYLLSLHSVTGLDIRRDIPPAAFNVQLVAHAAVPIPSNEDVSGVINLGLRPDLSNDNPFYNPEGAVALMFPFLEDAHVPGYRWHYDRFFGLEGAAHFEMDRAGVVWGYLFYPETTPPVPPDEAWGLQLHDGPTGTVVLRNRFADEDDTVFAMTARQRGVMRQAHSGPDVASLRILGLGSLWATGSGRTGRTGGQSTVMNSTRLASHSQGSSDTRNPGELAYLRFAPGSGGGSLTVDASANAENLSPSGVSGHLRRVVADFSPNSPDVEAFFVIADDSVDGDVWRLNTPEFNTITTQADGFVLTAPNGNRLVARVHAPVDPVIETGIFPRAGVVPFNGVRYDDSNWVQISGAEGNSFVVTMQLLRADVPEADMAFNPNGDNPVISLGSRSYTVLADRITVSDWPETVNVTATVEPEGAGTVVGTGAFTPGERTDLVPQPAPGYVFTGWSAPGTAFDEVRGFRAPYPLTVARDVEVTAHFGEAGADDSGDGLPNLIASALGLDPRAIEPPAHRHVVDRREDGSLAITFFRDPAREDVRYYVESSPDLSDWHVLFDSNDTPLNNRHGRMHVGAPLDGDRAFLRLRVDAVDGAAGD